MAEQRQRRIAVDGYTSDQQRSNGGEQSIAQIWNLLQKVYDLNRRDRTYAYRDAVTYARLNRLYSSFNGQCKFALLIHPGHRFLANYLNVADELAHRRGLIVLSLTYFGDGSGGGCSTEKTADDAAMAKRDFERDMNLLTTSTSDDEDGAVDDEPSLVEKERTEEGRTCERSGADYGGIRREEAEGEGRRRDENEGLDDDNDDDDNEEMLSVTTVRPLGKIGATAYMHNSVIETFFSELIKFVRPIPLCDEIGVISCMRTHKSYRLVHRNDLLQWYREVSSLTNDASVD